MDAQGGVGQDGVGQDGVGQSGVGQGGGCSPKMGYVSIQPLNECIYNWNRLCFPGFTLEIHQMLEPSL